MKTTILTKRRYELLNSIFNEKIYDITKKYHGDDGETQVPSLMEVSKYLMYGKKTSLKAGSEYEFGMSFEWINETVDRIPIHLQVLS